MTFVATEEESQQISAVPKTAASLLPISCVTFLIATFVTGLSVLVAICEGGRGGGGVNF
jgi:hypothetical protein